MWALGSDKSMFKLTMHSSPTELHVLFIYLFILRICIFIWAKLTTYAREQNLKCLRLSLFFFFVELYGFINANTMCTQSVYFFFAVQPGIGASLVFLRHSKLRHSYASNSLPTNIPSLFRCLLKCHLIRGVLLTALYKRVMTAHPSTVTWYCPFPHFPFTGVTVLHNPITIWLIICFHVCLSPS